ncbi:MAG TPA: efflux RND transporter periplasmic adaptor subunit [Thermoanaerobaculia bacterium]|nr:efflux RND transporter periplasmic adaptor subunit [Thermoanaerobaculia bacterium]
MRQLAPFAIPCAFLAVACHPAEVAAPQPPRPVTVQAVIPPDRPPAVRYSADIEPDRQVGVAFKVGGYVRDLAQRRGPAGANRATGADTQLRPLDAGDPVERGSLLARLEPADFRDRLAQAQAALAEARAGQARAEADLGRAQTLYAGRSLTRTDFDAATAAAAAGRARAEGAEAQLGLAATALSDSTLTAPFAGTLLARKVEVGTLVSPGTVGFVLADNRTVKAVFGVPDAVVGRLHAGDPLTLRADAPGAAGFTGRISSISPSADPQARVFRVEVKIANLDGRLRPGMIASVEVPEGTLGGNAAAIPTVSLTAVVRSPRTPGGYAVFVVNEDGAGTVARSRDVTLGEVYGNAIAVSSGLRVGERVVTTGAALLTDGDRVRVIP